MSVPRGWPPSVLTWLVLIEHPEASACDGKGWTRRCFYLIRIEDILQHFTTVGDGGCSGASFGGTGMGNKTSQVIRVSLAISRTPRNRVPARASTLSRVSSQCASRRRHLLATQLPALAG